MRIKLLQCNYLVHIHALISLFLIKTDECTLIQSCIAWWWGYVLRNASLGDFVVVRTSYSVLTQTQTVQYSLLHTHAIRYSLLQLGYKPVQHVAVLNIVGNCNTAVSIVMLYWNIMGLPLYMRSVDCNIVMQRMTVLFTLCHSDMFQPSKDHPQGVRQIHYNSKMSYQM